MSLLITLVQQKGVTSMFSEVRKNATSVKAKWKTLRISLFSFCLGVWIGYFKLIFHLIDNNKKSIISIFQSFYLLPKVLLARLLSYCAAMPFFIFIINKFPYDIQKYGTNFEINIPFL